MEWIPGERPEEREEKAKALGARPEDMNWNAYFPGAIMAHTLDSPGWTTFLYIDCIDSYLDFRAAETAVKGLHASGIQTVLTTRHLELFTTRLFRPDCCFVMEKGTVDCLPRLTDMELREGHNLGRLLRGGEFTRLDG